MQQSAADSKVNLLENDTILSGPLERVHIGETAAAACEVHERKAHRPTISEMPPELIIQIFSWLRPKATLQMQRLSRYLRACLSSQHFAATSLRKFITPSTEFFASNREFDELFFKFPPPYPSLCAEYVVRVLKAAGWTDLSWGDLTLVDARLPREVGEFTYFTGFHIVNRSLTGPIPAEIANISTLERIDLSLNNLTGTIPAALGRVRGLRHVNLAANKLGGTIPAELGALGTLQELDVSRNALVGAIPSALGGLVSLRGLDASQNALCGEIPVALCVGAVAASLVRLDLSRNRLCGRIPREIGRLVMLQKLVLSENRLSGAIPDEICHLSRLVVLFLCYNQLDGWIPKNIGMLRNMRWLRLDGNMLCGPVPHELLAIPDLEHADLTENSGLIKTVQGVQEMFLLKEHFLDSLKKKEL
ncbi:hypothetical protein HDU83_008418 [Entophlyctis luteolus]|nr:hypothetical protein HDU83_008418 [Entophlyctis luteolus]